MDGCPRGLPFLLCLLLLKGNLTRPGRRVQSQSQREQPVTPPPSTYQTYQTKPIPKANPRTDGRTDEGNERTNGETSLLLVKLN
jgi:hypothetical protein